MTSPTGSPSWRVKTVLQRTVQVLKLHRNGFFANDPDNRPPSCVITTLAGRAYTGEASLGDALVAAASDMPRYLDMNGTEWVLENPAQPGDNLADRWTQSADARDRFLPWLADLRNTLVTAQQTRSGMQSVVDTLSTRFDRSLMEKSVTAYAERQRGRRQLGALTVTGAGTLATGGRTTVRDHTFHGE